MRAFFIMGRNSKIITAEQILYFTDNGRDIFERELGKISETRNICSPLRTGDKNPSFRIKRSGTTGIWIFIDYGGNQDTGNAITFVSKLYNLSFSEAIDKIAQDFQLHDTKKTYVKNIIEDNSPIINKKKIVIDWEERKFTDKHKRYFDQFYLDEAFCNKYDIYALAKYAIDKKVHFNTIGEYQFVYVYKDVKGNETGECKILHLGPNVEKKNKWITNIPNTSLWYLEHVKKETPLFVAKSNKDTLCLFKQGINAICTQSENDVILSNNIPFIKTLNDRLVINFGSDPQAKRCSIKVSKEHNLEWFNTPNNVLSFNVEDNANYVKMFGEKSFRQLLKKKNYL